MSKKWMIVGLVGAVGAALLVVGAVVLLGDKQFSEPARFEPRDGVVELSENWSLQLPGFSPGDLSAFPQPGWAESPDRLVLARDGVTPPLFAVVEELDESFAASDAAGLVYVTSWGPYNFGVEDPSESWDVGRCRFSLRVRTSPSPEAPSVGVAFLPDSPSGFAVAVLGEDTEAVRGVLDGLAESSCS